ncbi:HTH-type transcriptional regulator EthR [Paraconexibacter sp. AEG42_29]|uniref:HTH-type transcriptional regulator EthR n=1 Tax=Paraconexibacter sp. AEG42_29 TaxID=2997339 RepID=A0AAU7AUH2_9ACTN
MSAQPTTVRGQERRGAILEALERLLRDRPLASIDVAQLSAEAGMTRSGFYFYFPTKEAAIEVLLGDLYEEMVGFAAPFFDGDAPPSVELHEALGHVAALWATHEHLLGAMVTAASTDPRAGATWDAWTAAWVERVATTIAAERRRGVAPDGPDPQELAQVLIGMNIHAFQQPGPAPLDALTAVWSNAIYGVRP